MASNDVIPHSCKLCQKLVIDFCGENIAEFDARHARIRATNPHPGPAPRPSCITDGRMKVSKLKFDVTRHEIIRWASEGCLLCRFLVDECKLPDGCDDFEDIVLWGEDLTRNTDSFDIERVGFGWAGASVGYPKLDIQAFTVYASQGM